MKLTITRACGHTDTIEVFGTNVHGERDKKVAYEETKMCKECYNKSISNKNVEAGMVALTGSEKQIAWAEKIRAKAIDDLDAIKTQEEKDETFKAKIKTILLEQSESKWWIENKDNAIKVVAKSIKDEYK